MTLTQLFKADFSPKLIEVRIFTAIISLLFSLLAFYTDDLINSDGVLYMDMVRALLAGGLSATAELYDWPFFSILVAGVHKLTGLSLEYSGNLVNIIMLVIFTDALVLICNKILPNSRQVFIAAVFILGFTLFNDYRAYLFRDMGYWAFSALALYQFIKFLEKPTWLNAFFWQLTTIIAILFRVEGIAILLALPFFVFFQKNSLKSAFNQLFKLWFSVALLALITIIVALGLSDFPSAFGKFNEIMMYINLDQLSSGFDHKSTIIAEQLLNKYSDKYSALIFGSGLFVMMLWKFIEALSISYIIFYIYIFFSKNKPKSIERKYSGLLIYFIAINFIVLSVFVFTHFFLSTRYSVMLVTGLFLLFLLPLFCSFVEKALLNRNNGILVFTLFVILVGPIDSFTRSVSKEYVKEIAIWSAENIPGDSKVAINEREMSHYMQEKGFRSDITFIRELDFSKFERYDYIIIAVKHDKKQLKKDLDKLGYKLIYTTNNDRGDEAYLYQVR